MSWWTCVRGVGATHGWIGARTGSTVVRLPLSGRVTISVQDSPRHPPGTSGGEPGGLGPIGEQRNGMKAGPRTGHDRRDHPRGRSRAARVGSTSSRPTLPELFLGGPPQHAASGLVLPGPRAGLCPRAKAPDSGPGAYRQPRRVGHLLGGLKVSVQTFLPHLPAFPQPVPSRPGSEPFVRPSVPSRPSVQSAWSDAPPRQKRVVRRVPTRVEPGSRNPGCNPGSPPRARPG